MRITRLSLLTACLFPLIGCGETASTPPPSATPNSFACAAIQLGNQGHWADAQHRWLSAQQGSTDGGAVAAFLVLNLDSARLAADQFTGESQTADLATYHSDLSGDGAFTQGC